MQSIFPEGWFFSHALYAFSWVNVGLVTEDPLLKQQAIREVRWVLKRMETPDGLEPFLEDTQVKHGVFYLGWRNRLLGGLLALDPGDGKVTDERALFRRQSEELAQAFLTTPSRHLDAYPGHAWPCDNVIALASLRLHDELFDVKYQGVIDFWLDFTQKHLDPRTGMIGHKIDGRNGEILIQPRASTQVYIHAFLPELNSDFAHQQYGLFREIFVENWLGYLPVREYPKGLSGVGDIDTGPLILGISPSATVVSIAAARANGDFELAERSVILSETVGFPWTFGAEKSFGLGQLVVADAFLVWGKTLVPWVPTPETSYPATTLSWWRFRLHLLSVLLLAFLGGGIRWMWRKRESKARRFHSDVSKC